MVAFGLDVEISNIRSNDHSGKLQSVMTQRQAECGPLWVRRSSRAVCYCNTAAAGGGGGGEAVLQAFYADASCPRKTILEGFVIPDMCLSLTELKAL